MKLLNILAKNMKYLEDAGYVLPSSVSASIIYLAIILDLKQYIPRAITNCALL
jgi:hypothetical protein